MEKQSLCGASEKASCGRKSSSEILRIGEKVGPEVHDTRRDGVIMLEVGENVAPKDHDTRHTDVVVPEEPDVLRVTFIPVVVPTHVAGGGGGASLPRLFPHPPPASPLPLVRRRASRRWRRRWIQSAGERGRCVFEWERVSAGVGLHRRPRLPGRLDYSLQIGEQINRTKKISCSYIHVSRREVPDWRNLVCRVICRPYAEADEWGRWRAVADPPPRHGSRSFGCCLRLRSSSTLFILRLAARADGSCDIHAVNQQETLLESRQRRGANGDVVACSSKLPLVHRLLFCLSRKVTTRSNWRDKHSMELKALILKEGNYSKVHTEGCFEASTCFRSFAIHNNTS
ncbi:uncharacterized protein LOC125533233 [Triticum urartu]|uniref:uncharacterized protein LOC125533233 n=1 Tax=Triticum urartu TaxID=4572 RepID=UPI0020448345|nr:uncharacterized protein LOC125533233 [Triticum urartu]